MMHSCDVLVVGAGPAGLVAAEHASRVGNRNVLLIDAGNDLHMRNCPALKSYTCAPCRRCDLLQGVGGASGVVGGKLCYFPAGKRLAHHVGMSSQEANLAITELLDQLSQYLPTPSLCDGLARNACGAYTGQFTLNEYESFPLLWNDLHNLFSALRSSALRRGVSIQCLTTLMSLHKGNGQYAFCARLTQQQREVQVRVRDSVVLATGRSSSMWLCDLIHSLDIDQSPSNVDVGIRMECDAGTLADYLGNIEDPKLVSNAGSASEVRTLCWCRGGSMTVTSPEGYQLVDGHFGEHYSDRTSVSIVARRPVPASTTPIEYAAKLMGHAPGMRVRSSSLLRFLALPEISAPSRELRVLQPCETDPMNYAEIDYNLITDLRSFLLKLCEDSGGHLTSDPTGVVYGPVIDQQWPAPALNQSLESSVPNLFFAGDIQGHGRGIVQAMLSGLIVGRALSDHSSTVSSSVKLIS